MSNTTFSDDGFSTFGKYDVNFKYNYDGAVSMYSTHSQGSDRKNVDMRVIFDSTYLSGDFEYDIYYVGTCKVWKFEYKRR